VLGTIKKYKITPIVGTTRGCNMTEMVW
jgi:hypothetical protein